VRDLRYAVASEQTEDDDVYHYLPDGGNLTMCGREPQEIMAEVPDDRRLCEACDREEFPKRLKNMDDETLSNAGWDLVRENRSRENHLLLISEAAARNLPICRGTKTSGPHAAIPLIRRNGQSSPCPICGDVKLN
jgi:hypothetical protein